MSLSNSLRDEASLSRTSLLREQAYHELKRLVLNGKLAQAPFLSSRSLAKQLGMGMTPVRSAVERLETEGLLSIGPQRGLVINELTASEIVDHFEIREALETMVVRKLAGRLQPDQIAELRAKLAENEACIATGDVEANTRCDGEFHLLLAEFSRNADIERVLRQLRDRIFRVVLRVIEHAPQRMHESVVEHRQLVELLVAGDGDRAAALLVQHLRCGLRAALPGLQRASSTDGFPPNQ